MVSKNTSLILILLILGSLFAVYSNSFYGDWVFDDPHNIVYRSDVHLEKLTPHNIANTFFKEKDGELRLYRPVSCFTLGLNWFFGETNPRGYHVVNLIIHLIATVLVFKTTRLLLVLLHYKGNILFVAGLVTVLWAIHPIQTQAVSYIVQRMASLAAMFYLAGIYFYLLFKREKSKKWMAISLIMFLLAVFSKENAALFPFSIIMIELLLADKLHFKKQHVLIAGIVSVAVILSFFLLFRGSFHQGLLEGYANRPFNMQERVLTESRVVLFHLYQLFVSPPEAFGFNQPITLSKNLFQPVTTFFSLIGILIVIGLSAYCLIFRKEKSIKLCGFAFLFFFVHHSVESTIFPLEIYFEHRNYLPSVFIFLPVALLAAYIVDKYKHSPIKWLIVIAFSAAIAGMGLTTYSRNFIWQSRIQFWKAAIENNPESFRPYHNLAYAYDPYAVDPVKNNLDKAISLYETALRKKYTASNSKKRITLYNLAVIYAANKDYERAISYLKRYMRYLQFKKIKIPPKAYRKMSVCLLKTHNLEEALSYAEKGSAQYSDQIDLYGLKGFILTLSEKNEEGLKSYRKGLALNKAGYSPLFKDYGVALAHSGYYERGLWFLEKYFERNKEDAIPLFFMANNLIAQKKTEEADFYLEKLFETASAAQVQKMIQKMYDKRDTYYLLLNKDMMRKTIAKKFKALIDTQ